MNLTYTLWSWRRLLRVPWTERDPTNPFKRRLVLGVHWKDDSEAETPIFWSPDVKS